MSAGGQRVFLDVCHRAKLILPQIFAPQCLVFANLKLRRAFEDFSQPAVVSWIWRKRNSDQAEDGPVVMEETSDWDDTASMAEEVTQGSKCPHCHEDPMSSRKGSCKPIEEQMSETKLRKIWDTYAQRGQQKCIRIFFNDNSTFIKLLEIRISQADCEPAADEIPSLFP